MLWNELAFEAFIHTSLLGRYAFSFSLAVAYVVDELQCIEQDVFLALSELGILFVISFAGLLNLLDFADVDLLFEGIQFISHVSLLLLKKGKGLAVFLHAKATGRVDVDVVLNEESLVLEGLQSSLAVGPIFFWHAEILQL